MKKQRNAPSYVNKTLISGDKGLSVSLGNIRTDKEEFRILNTNDEMNEMIHVKSGVRFDYPDDFLVSDFKIAEREK